MDDRRLPRTTSSGRVPWSSFCVVSACVLAMGFFVALRTGGATSAGMTLLFGVIVVGIAAALLSSILSPLPDSTWAAHGMGSGFAGGGTDGGGVGGGDCGG